MLQHAEHRGCEHGPYYSSATGAARAIVSRGAKSVVGATSSAPGNEYNNDGAVLVGQAAGLPTDSVFIDTPITDPSSTALDLYNRAGDGGGVVLTFTAPDALPILQAAEQQGLLDKVLWSCATPLQRLTCGSGSGPAVERSLLRQRGVQPARHDRSCRRAALRRAGRGVRADEARTAFELRSDGLPRRQVHDRGAAPGLLAGRADRRVREPQR